MNQKLLCQGLALGIASIFLSPDASAQIFLGNLAGSNDNGGASTISGTAWRAISFTTPNQAYNLNSVDLRLTNFEVTDTPRVGLLTDNAGTPGSLLGGSYFNNPSAATGPATFTFTPASSLQLAANTTYYLVVGATSGSFLSFDLSSPIIIPSSDVGTTFNAPYRTSSNGGSTFTGTSFNYNTFQINATPVPEPAAYTFVAAGALLGFGAWRRCQKKSA